MEVQSFAERSGKNSPAKRNKAWNASKPDVFTPISISKLNLNDKGFRQWLLKISAHLQGGQECCQNKTNPWWNTLYWIFFSNCLPWFYGTPEGLTQQLRCAALEVQNGLLSSYTVWVSGTVPMRFLLPSSSLLFCPLGKTLADPSLSVFVEMMLSSSSLSPTFLGLLKLELKHSVTTTNIWTQVRDQNLPATSISFSASWRAQKGKTLCFLQFHF